MRMGRIIADRYPDLSDEDREAVRQHAVAAMALVQKAKANTPPMSPARSRRGTRPSSMGPGSS